MAKCGKKQCGQNCVGDVLHPIGPYTWGLFSGARFRPKYCVIGNISSKAASSYYRKVVHKIRVKIKSCPGFSVFLHCNLVCLLHLLRQGMFVNVVYYSLCIMNFLCNPNNLMILISNTSIQHTYYTLSVLHCVSVSKSDQISSESYLLAEKTNCVCPLLLVNGTPASQPSTVNCMKSPSPTPASPRSLKKVSTLSHTHIHLHTVIQLMLSYIWLDPIHVHLQFVLDYLLLDY